MYICKWNWEQLKPISEINLVTNIGSQNSEIVAIGLMTPKSTQARTAVIVISEV